MTICCERCGKETNLEEAYKITMAKHNRVESRTLCENCKLLSEAFMTAAYISGISRTQYDLLLHMAQNVKKKVLGAIVQELVEELRNAGMTVPEIAQELHICNQCVMNLTRKDRQ